MIFLTILLPLILGSLSCGIIYFYFRTHDTTNQHGILSLLLGYGYIIGIFTTTLIMRMWDAIGLRLEFLPLSSVLFVLCGLAIACLPTTIWKNKYFFNIKLSNHSYVVIILLLTLIGIRLVLLSIEIWLRPLYPWDAWFAWGQKTAVWFELRQLVTFATPTEWPGSATAPIFTAPAYSYPPTIPLIQVWTLLALNQWDDALMNISWLMCVIALGLGIYGQLRQWGIQTTRALLWVYLLLSLPLLNVHVALAGYADLWLATGYGFTLMAWLLWIRHRQAYQIWLGIFTAIFTINTKSEGLIWIVTLIPVLLIAIGYHVTLILKLISGILVIVGSIYLLTPLEFQFLGLGKLIINANLLQIPGLPPLILARQEIVLTLIKHLFIMGNWHILWFIVIGTLIPGMWYLAHNSALIAAYLTVGANIAFLGLMFGFTEFGRWAEDATIINRLLLHAVPGMVFISAIVTNEFLNRPPTQVHIPHFRII